jgi:hypothetical protein
MSEGQADEPGGVPQLRWLILLSCGHWLIMKGPAGYPEPADGEERTCGAVGHYPRKYAAFYIRLDDEGLGQLVDEALYAAGSLRTGPPPV